MKSLKYLNKYIWKYKWSFLLGLVFIILTNIFKVYQPVIIGESFNEISDQISLMKTGEVTYNSSVFIKLGFRYAGMYILLSVISGLFLFFTRQTIIVMSRKIEFDLKNEIYKHYQILDQTFYKQHNTGDIMNRISEDVSKVRMYLGPSIMYTINLFFTFILIVYFMLKVNVELTFYALLPLPIMSLLIYKISNVMNKKSQAVQKQQSRLSTFVQEAFSGIRVLKAYNRIFNSNERFQEEIKDYKVKVLQQVKIDAWFMPTIVILVGLSTILTIYVGGLKTIEGEIRIGEIAEFVIYINMLTWPFASLGWVTSITQRAAASQQRINQFLQAKPLLNENKDGENINDFNVLEFKNVSFTYQNSGIQALKDISFSLKKDQTLAVLGKTGSGKSTLAQLIGRLYEPSSGEIDVNQRNLRNIKLSSYRRKIAYVPQEVFLFSDTIYNNIKFGDVDLSKEKAEEYAKMAGVHHNVVEFPDEYETMLGERGINLSGGQKQRLSIARAFAKQPQLLLLDDCLSAVDTETEEMILQSLNQINKGLMKVIISHRVSSVQNADKIIFLKEGSIVEQGNHDDLMSLKGEYYSLYNKQLLENEK